MKKILSLLAFLLFAVSGHAQKSEKAKLAFDSIASTTKTVMYNKEITVAKKSAVYAKGGSKTVCDSLNGWVCDKLKDAGRAHISSIPSLIGQGGSRKVGYNATDYAKYVTSGKKAWSNVAVHKVYEDNDYVTLEYVGETCAGGDAETVREYDVVTFSKADGHHVGWSLLKGLSKEKVIDRLKKLLKMDDDAKLKLPKMAAYMVPEGVRVTYREGELDAEAHTCLVRRFNDDFSVDGVRYHVTSRRTRRCEIANQQAGAKGDVVVPKKVKVNGLSYQVTRIADRAFAGCTQLQSIVLPETLRNLGEGAFSNCTALQKAELPAGIKSIGESTFKECTALRSITIPEGVQRIGTQAFRECNSLEEVNLPNSLEYIGNSAFNRCTSLREIIIPEECAEVDFLAFESCTALTTVTLLGDETDVNFCAFEECNAISTIYNLSPVPQDISANTFPASAVIYVLPDSKEDYLNETNWRGVDIVEIAEFEHDGLVYDITSGDDRICSVKGVDSGVSAALHIPSKVRFRGLDLTVTDIADRALADCSNIVSVEVPATVTTIGREAFEGCLMLRTVSLASDSTRLGDHAFHDCAALATVVLPRRLSSIGEGVFDGCKQLDGVVLPATLPAIPAATFKDCISLSSIAIPQSVTTIGAEAFAGCFSLKSVVLPPSLGSIASGTFMNCKGLTSVTLPTQLHMIDSEAFKGCSVLPAITLPASLIMLGDDAFAACPLLATVTNLSEVPQTIESGVFSKSGTLHVPVEAKTAYKRAKGWKHFTIKNDIVPEAPAAPQQQVIEIGLPPMK